MAVWVPGQPGPGGTSDSTLIIAKCQMVLSLAQKNVLLLGFCGVGDLEIGCHRNKTFPEVTYAYAISKFGKSIFVHLQQNCASFIL